MDPNFGKKVYFEKIFSESSEKSDPWGSDWRASQQYRYELYEKILSEEKNIVYSKILDIGCSLGDFTIREQKIFKPKELWGIDTSSVAISKARNKYPSCKINFKEVALPDLSFFKDDEFDLITALEVIYYLDRENRIRALSEIKRVLKPGKFLLISVNINNPPYFKIDEFESLLNDFFEIKKCGYYYGKIHYFFESKMIRLEKTPLRGLNHYILSNKFLVRLGDFLTRIIMKKSGITIMYALCQNK